jgi:hypothetical protein
MCTQEVVEAFSGDGDESFGLITKLMSPTLLIRELCINCIVYVESN